jgi:hypothetical protein
MASSSFALRVVLKSDEARKTEIYPQKMTWQ